MTAVWVWTHGRSVSASLVSPALTRSGLIKIDAIHVLTGLKAPHESRRTRHRTHFLFSFLTSGVFALRVGFISMKCARAHGWLAEHGFHASHLSLSTHGVAFGSIAAQTSAPSHQSDNGAVRSPSQQPCTLFCVLRHRLLGQKYGTESELDEWK